MKAATKAALSLCAVAGIFGLYMAATSLARPLSHNSILTSSNSAGALDAQSPVEPCTYVVFKDNSTIFAKNCATGFVDYSGNDSSAVLNKVFGEIDSAGGGVVYVKGYGVNNPYLITSPLEIPDSGHLTFTGDGPEFTVLKVPAGHDNNLFEFVGEKKRNSFFNEFRNFEGVGNPGGMTNTGFFLNSSSYGVSDSLWFNVFLRDFKHDDIYFGQHNSWNNRLDSCTIELAGRAGLYRSGGIDSSDARIVDTKFLFNNQYGVYDASDFGTYSSDWFYKNRQTALEIAGGAKTVIADNRFQDNGVSANNTYYDLLILGNYVDVTGNVFYGSEAGTNESRSSIVLGPDTEHNLIANNIIGNGHFGDKQVTIDADSKFNSVVSNQGWNPRGIVSLPFNDTAGVLTPDGGGNRTPAPGTEYTVLGSDILMTSTGGTGVSITIKDPSGKILSSGVKELEAMPIPRDYKVDFGSFNSPPNVTVAFN